MENEALKDYEVGEWILYTVGEHNLGLGEVSGFEVKGSKPEDITIRLRVWTGPNYKPKATDVLCNVSKEGHHEAYLVWKARKISIVEEFCLKAKLFTAEAFNTRDRPYNYTLQDSWNHVLDWFIGLSENMVNVYKKLETLKMAEEDVSKNKG